MAKTDAEMKAARDAAKARRNAARNNHIRLFRGLDTQLRGVFPAGFYSLQVQSFLEAKGELPERVTRGAKWAITILVERVNRAIEKRRVLTAKNLMLEGKVEGLEKTVVELEEKLRVSEGRVRELEGGVKEESEDDDDDIDDDEDEEDT